jgi:hypothetical protein
MIRFAGILTPPVSLKMVQFLNTGFTQMAMSPPPIFEGNDY